MNNRILTYKKSWDIAWSHVQNFPGLIHCIIIHFGFYMAVQYSDVNKEKVSRAT